MLDNLSGPSTRRSRRRAAGVLAAATLLLAPAAAHAAQWADGPAFSAGPTAIGSHLAIGPDGSATQTWIDLSVVEGALDTTRPAYLKAQRAASDGSVGQAVRVATFLPEDVQLDSLVHVPTAVATGAGGTTAVAWMTPAASGDVEVDLAFLGAGGGVSSPVRVGEFSMTSGGGTAPGLSLGVDGAGTATVVFDGVEPDSSDTAVTVARVSPGGAPRTTLIATDDWVSPTVAVSPAGVAWVAWGTETGSQVARFAADGSLNAEPQSFGAAAKGVTLATSVNGAAVAGVDATTNTVVGARLAPAGDLLAGGFHTASGLPPELSEASFLPALALGPDGTVTVARTVAIGQTAAQLDYTRIVSGASTGPAQDVTVPSDSYPLLPALAAASDGTVLIAWMQVTAPDSSELPEPFDPPTLSPVQARLVAPDGALGPIMNAGSAGPMYNGTGRNVLGSALAPFVSGGNALLGLPQGTMQSSLTASVGPFKLRALDFAPPAVDVSVPATAVVGTPVAFAATTDEPGVELRWDFGDGSGAPGAAVAHAYGVVGTYAIRLTATDRVGNVTEVTRHLTITAPAALPALPITPAPTMPTPPTPPAGVARATPKAAALKIARATRSGASVTVSGTIAVSAGGSVTIAYAQRVGRAKVTLHKSASIRRGRWTATLRLPARVARAGTRATVTVAYRGDAKTLKATARKAVTRAKPKPGKASKPKSRRRG